MKRSSAEKLVHRRNIKNNVLKGAVISATLVAILPLIFILYYIIEKGITSINWNFFTQLPKPVGETGGGILNAIVGSAIIIFMACIIAIPISIAIGIYLSEFPKTRLAGWTQLGVNVLQGV